MSSNNVHYYVTGCVTKAINGYVLLSHKMHF